ncbi:MAG: tRNA uridine-5-carboxymethylaminomethyl(34) synthesis GTPase MnmE [Chitinophagales bacterium]
MDSETIVAVATPPGLGAVGVLRLSGPHAVKIADRVFRPLHGSVPLRETKSHRVRHGLAVFPGTGRVGDEVLVFVARGPRSYTGEDVVEFSCHGGPAPVGAVLDALVQAGARPARPGEFTLRAFLNGRMDLSQAEAVSDIVRARSGEALAAAVAGLQGKLGERIRASAAELVDLLAHLEAALDFDDQEVPPVQPGEVGAATARVERQLRELVSGARAGRLYREGLRVVLAGRPNVGKSSLLNVLTGRDRAIVTEVPGTTRDPVEDSLVVDGVPVCLVDTAGLRETADRIEAEGVRRAEAAVEAASVAVLVVDGSAPLTSEDFGAARRMPVPAGVVAVNKADLPQVVEACDVEALVPGARLVRVSALRGSGLAGFWREVMAAAGLGGEGGSGLEGRQDALVTSARHEEALRRAIRELEGARVEAGRGGGEELVAARVRAALRALGEITGESVDEEVLAAIFSSFCLGK